MRQHYKSIYQFLVHLAGNANCAEDLTQDTFAAAWTSFSQMREPASFKAWLHRIAYRKFIDSGRRAHRDMALAEKLKYETPAAEGPLSPPHALAAEQRTQQLYAAINDLDGPKHLTILLHYIQGLSFRQMARVLDEPAGTVKWRTSQALRELRAILDGRTQ